MNRANLAGLAAPILLAIATFAQAETGAEGWLRYAPLAKAEVTRYATLPNQIVVLGNTATDQAAANELQRGLTSMLGRTFTISHQMEDEFASWRCGINLLCEADELDPALLEALEELNEMGE